MPLVAWTRSLSVGIPEIDRQHRRLVDMINLLHEAHRLGQGQAALDAIFAAMTDYARQHFSYEEELLAAAQYPQLAAHKRLHATFMTRLGAMQAKQQQAGQVLLSMEVLRFLKEWLIEHIEGSDQRYVSHLTTAARS